MPKSTQTPLQRINRIENFYHKRGVNKESVNTVKRKIISFKFSKQYSNPDLSYL